MKKLLFLILPAMILGACKKNGPAAAELRITTQWKFGNAPLDTNTYYLLGNKKIKIRDFRMILSRFAYKDALGTDPVFAEGTRALMSPGDTTWNISFTSPPWLDIVYIGLGVEPEMNTENGSSFMPPSSYPAEDPLSDENGMFISDAEGYIFLHMEGEYDVDGDQFIEPPQELFSITIGGDILYRNFERNVNFDLSEGISKDVKLDIHLDGFLTGSFDLANHMNVNATGTGDPDYAAAEALMNQFNQVFGNFYQ